MVSKKKKKKFYFSELEKTDMVVGKNVAILAEIRPLEKVRKSPENFF